MTLILSQWRIILLAAVIALAYYYKTCYEASVAELATFKADIATLKGVKENENKILRNYAENTVSNLTDKHNNELKGIENDFIKQNKLSSITISNLRNSLRQSISSADDVSEVDTNTERTTEEWRNRYATIVGQYETLKQGCTITTSDYNLLRGWGDAACLQVGCE